MQDNLGFALIILTSIIMVSERANWERIVSCPTEASHRNLSVLEGFRHCPEGYIHGVEERVDSMEETCSEMNQFLDDLASAVGAVGADHRELRDMPQELLR